MRTPPATLLPLILVAGACAIPSAAPRPALPTATTDGGFQEVHFVEASGPPRRAFDTVADPIQDPVPQDPPKSTPRGPEDTSTPEAPADAQRRELEREQRRRIDAEQTITRLEARIHDLEARVLSLTLERAMFEQEVLRLRIDAAKAELATLGAVPMVETAPAPKADTPPERTTSDGSTPTTAPVINQATPPRPTPTPNDVPAKPDRIDAPRVEKPTTMAPTTRRNDLR